MKYSRVTVILLFFVLPALIAALPGVPVWLGRTMAISILFLFATIGIFWFGLSQKSKMIRGGVLAEARFDEVRPKIELGIRTVVVAFGVVFFFYTTLPLASDLYHLVTGSKPAMLTATVAHKTSSLGGVLLGERSVRFAGNGKSYYIFYSWTSPIYIGSSYEFTVLPRCKMILDFHEVAASSTPSPDGSKAISPR